MLLEGVRTLDEAVEEVREDRREKEQNRLRRKDQEKLDRAHIKALNRQNRAWRRVGRGGTQVDVPAIAPAAGSTQSVVEPAISEPGQLPLRPRPSLQAVTGPSVAPERSPDDPVTVDLTAEDDTQALPRLDSLERKLKDLEQQFG